MGDKVMAVGFMLQPAYMPATPLARGLERFFPYQEDLKAGAECTQESSQPPSCCVQ